MSDLASAACVITGATKGIGRETAMHLAEHGARVVVTSRTLGAAEAVAAKIEAIYGASRALPAVYDVLEQGGRTPRANRSQSSCGDCSAYGIGRHHADL
ncbi:hypothetical protein C1T17_12340 [Sphingobium sp. SCG-1]|uniref:SDR family NAD(P)-dependent oxidoreductase n=1 Tax=Sphingobium sp. SCG-1 TaxID=2072936 RepID=UPI000CD69E13|nr:hypothetical protein C1T17_12340 [Sphingobium sp. SCG-1]